MYWDFLGSMYWEIKIISDMSVVIVEKVFSEDRLLREERESDFIRLFNSRAKGLNIDT